MMKIFVRNQRKHKLVEILSSPSPSPALTHTYTHTYATVLAYHVCMYISWTHIYERPLTRRRVNFISHFPLYLSAMIVDPVSGKCV